MTYIVISSVWGLDCKCCSMMASFCRLLTTKNPQRKISTISWAIVMWEEYGVVVLREPTQEHLSCWPLCYIVKRCNNEGKTVVLTAH